AARCASPQAPGRAPVAQPVSSETAARTTAQLVMNSSVRFQDLVTFRVPSVFWRKCPSRRSAACRSAIISATESAFTLREEGAYRPGGTCCTFARVGMRVRAAIPLLAGTAQALTFSWPAARVRDHLLSNEVYRGHVICTVRRTFATVTPPSETTTRGCQNTSQISATISTTTGPERHNSSSPPWLKK